MGRTSWRSQPWDPLNVREPSQSAESGAREEKQLSTCQTQTGAARGHHLQNEMEKAMCPLPACMLSRQGLSAWVRRGAEQLRAMKKNEAGERVQRPMPQPHLLPLPPFPAGSSWALKCRIYPGLRHTTEAEDGRLQEGTMWGTERTLTNFLSIFALMSLARVKNACGIRMLLASQQWEADGHPLVPRRPRGVGQWGGQGSHLSSSISYPCPPRPPLPRSPQPWQVGSPLTSQGEN